ncbi:hypothetical protein YC2023_098914 [Brassica napus]
MEGRGGQLGSFPLMTSSTSVNDDYLSPDLGLQLSLVGPEKVSIDSNNGVSIDTPYSPSINATSELSIEEPSREHYRTGLTCSLGLIKSASACV